MIIPHQGDYWYSTLAGTGITIEYVYFSQRLDAYIIYFKATVIPTEINLLVVMRAHAYLVYD